MNILGIETSCDETAAAIVQDGQLIHSNIVVSSLKEHEKYGGIIPEIASRRQLECIQAVVEQALEKAKMDFDKIDAIAVTSHPGLIGSLLVGLSFSRALSYRTNKKLIEVDHIRAHLYANFLRFPDEDKALPSLPAIGLVVSGGHTSLYHITRFDQFDLLGQTRDDAAGEAFDKVARILNLGYPGGPAIQKTAQKIKNTDLQFTSAQLPATLDFSFSGIKTAVLYHHRDYKGTSSYPVEEVAFAFQDSVTKVLAEKSIKACRQKNCKTLLVGGGVAANTSLRQKLIDLGQKNNIDVFFPPMSLCLDNAAMIAGLGYQILNQSKK
ncbi:MAG: tRNA (adenosine(37)-N6)-threonylcarbamoyltransferase complex transferase subunit TsaD [Candidatus Omnitrophica bacterium]|nr:tRNA (adenosine(37)-N6)-threonylcarbamoyltransferase complex transferase subunit TsaD [Candidatus Omnitrophota bacterium]